MKKNKPVGKKKMKVSFLEVGNEEHNENYYIGVSHNMGRKAFLDMAETCFKNQQTGYITSEDLEFIINTAPKKLGYLARLLTVEDKILIENNLQSNKEVIWK